MNRSQSNAFIRFAARAGRAAARFAGAGAAILAVSTVLWVTHVPQAIAAQINDVIVRNTAANPVPVKRVDEPARQPFYTHCGTASSNGGPITCSMGNVPAGKRLVIEAITASLVDAHGAIGSVALATQVAGVTQTHYLVATKIGDGGAFAYYAVHQATQIFADADTPLLAQVLEIDDVQVGFDLTISGELVDAL